MNRIASQLELGMGAQDNYLAALQQHARARRERRPGRKVWQQDEEAQVNHAL
jgi:hypothetical protein